MKHVKEWQKIYEYDELDELGSVDIDWDEVRVAIEELRQVSRNVKTGRFDGKILSNTIQEIVSRLEVALEL